MSQLPSSVALLLTDQSRRDALMQCAATERQALHARTEREYPLNAVAIAQHHHSAMLEEATQNYRVTYANRPPITGVAAITRMRVRIGTACIRFGCWLHGAASAPPATPSPTT